MSFLNRINRGALKFNSSSELPGTTDALSLNNTASGDHKFTLTDGTDINVNLDASRLWNNAADAQPGEWSNSEALARLNTDLGLSISNANITSLGFVSGGNAGSYTTVNLDFADTLVGEDMVFYVLATAPNSPLSGVSISGLENASMTWASSTGNGFQEGDLSVSSRTYALVRVEGALTESTVQISSSTAKTGWAMVAYNIVPEPATASLSLLGLAALMMRRRRA